MGRAIEVDNRLDKIEADLKWVINLLNQLSEVNSTKENIDIHEATKEKTNTKTSGKRSVKSDNGKQKKSVGDTKNTESA
tara:strand:+ start:1801 stop:2037 length:237 start_codon:yes stop_codon:yes gene_type:complete